MWEREGEGDRKRKRDTGERHLLARVGTVDIGVLVDIRQVR